MGPRSREAPLPTRHSLLALLVAAVNVASEPREDGSLMRREVSRKISKVRQDTQFAMDIHPNGHIAPHKLPRREPGEDSVTLASATPILTDGTAGGIDKVNGLRAPELSFADVEADDAPSPAGADAVAANAGQQATATAPPLPSQLPGGTPTVPVVAATAAPMRSNVTEELKAAKDRLDDLNWILTLWKGLALLLTLVLVSFAGLFAKETVAAKKDGHRTGYKDARARGRQEVGRSDGDGGLSGHEIRA